LVFSFWLWSREVVVGLHAHSAGAEENESEGQHWESAELGGLDGPLHVSAQ